MFDFTIVKQPLARNAQKVLLELNDEDTPGRYILEESAGENGRPDITGKTFSGRKTVIIEGKFWAKLTEKQPVNYLKELDVSGQLLFLSPEQRITSLKNEIRKRIHSQDPRISVHSWGNFLSVIDKENAKKFNKKLDSDIAQIKTLCDQMDSEGLPPLSASNHDPMNGKLMTHFSDIIDECNFLLRGWEDSDFSGLQRTSFKYGYGFYLRVYGIACYLCFHSEKWTLNKTHTSFWLILDHWEDERIQNKIPHFYPAAMQKIRLILITEFKSSLVWVKRMLFSPLWSRQKNCFLICGRVSRAGPPAALVGSLI